MHERGRPQGRPARAATSRTGRSPSSTPASTPTSACVSRPCSRTWRARRCSWPTTATVSPTCRCPTMIDYFREQRTRWPASPASRPTQSFHLVSVEDGGRVKSIRHVKDVGMRINGGFFVLRARDLRLDEGGRGAGRRSPSSASPPRESCSPIPTTASGRAWTPSRTSSSSRTSTRAARSRGRSGRRSVSGASPGRPKGTK